MNFLKTIQSALLLELDPCFGFANASSSCYLQSSSVHKTENNGIFDTQTHKNILHCWDSQHLEGLTNFPRQFS